MRFLSVKMTTVQDGYYTNQKQKVCKVREVRCSRPIILDRTFVYANNGSMSENAHLWNTTTMKVQRGTRVLHLTPLVE